MYTWQQGCGRKKLTAFREKKNWSHKSLIMKQVYDLGFKWLPNRRIPRICTQRIFGVLEIIENAYWKDNETGLRLSYFQAKAELYYRNCLVLQKIAYIRGNNGNFTFFRSIDTQIYIYIASVKVFNKMQ